MAHEQDAYPLSVGYIVGGPTQANAPWESALKRLTDQVIEAREGVATPLNVNIVFQVPGSILAPDFEGARTGSFSKSNSHLMVQVALPAGIPEDPDQYLRDLLPLAVVEVEKWNSRPGRQFDLSGLRAVLGRLSGM